VAVVTVLNEMSAGKNVSELEKEMMLNFLVKESIEIANEEIDYFFATKLRLVKAYVSGLEFKSITNDQLQEKFTVFMYSHEDILDLIRKIAKGIRRELARGQYSGDFQLTYNYQEVYARQICEHLAENIRTLKLSDAIGKAIDMTWKKTSEKLLPKELLILTPKFSLSSYLLGAAGVSPQSLREEIQVKMVRILSGIIKQQQIELKNELRQEIIKQLLAVPKESNARIKAIQTKTA
jgi:hypothetical protein